MEDQHYDTRIRRCLEVLQVRRVNDWADSGRMGDARAYAEREMILSQLIVLRSQLREYGVLLVFEKFALESIEVNLGLKSKAVWPL